MHDPFVQRDVWPVRNNSGEDVPVGAVMKVTGVDREVVQVTKPDADGIDPELLYVNVHGTIAKDAEGQGTQDALAVVAYDQGGADPSPFDFWGTVAGEWVLHRDRPGFKPHSRGTDGLAAFARAVQDVKLVRPTGDPLNCGSGGSGGSRSGSGDECSGKGSPGALDYVPAVVLAFDRDAETFVETRPVLLLEANGKGVRTDRRYLALRMTDICLQDGQGFRPLYVTDGGFGAGGCPGSGSGPDDHGPVVDVNCDPETGLTVTFEDDVMAGRGPPAAPPAGPRLALGGGDLLLLSDGSHLEVGR